MTENNNDNFLTVKELIEKQKKAKIVWVATITGVSEEEIKEKAEKFNLKIYEDSIMIEEEYAKVISKKSEPKSIFMLTKEDFESITDVNKLLGIFQQAMDRDRVDLGLLATLRGFELEPKNPYVLANLAFAYYVNKQSLKAIEIYDLFFEQHPDSPSELVVYAYANMSWVDYDSARKALIKSISLQPSGIAQKAQQELEQLVRIQQNELAKEVEEEKKRGNIKNPDIELKNSIQEMDNIDDLFKMAKVKKEHIEIVWIYDQILKLDSENINALTYYGTLLSNVGFRRLWGTLFLRKAVKLRPDVAELWVNLAMGLSRIGDFNNSLQSMMKAIEMIPENERYRNLLLNLEMQKMTQDRVMRTLGF